MNFGFEIDVRLMCFVRSHITERTKGRPPQGDERISIENGTAFVFPVVGNSNNIVTLMINDFPARGIDEARGRALTASYTFKCKSLQLNSDKKWAMSE